MAIQKLTFKKDSALALVNIQTTVNQLIDAINYHQKWLSEIQRDKDIQNASVEKAQDKFAEQRRWIGKACWFWDGNAQTKAFGQLMQIDPLDDGQNAPYQTNYGQWYEHCKPVKPTDSIIYQGEQQ